MGWRLAKVWIVVLEPPTKYDIRGILKGLCKMDRREYMKEYMRKKRVNKKVEEVNILGEVVNKVGKSQVELLAEKLIDPKWRELLEYLCENLKPEYANDVRVGCYGLTISEIKTVLPMVPNPAG